MGGVGCPARCSREAFSTKVLRAGRAGFRGPIGVNTGTRRITSRNHDDFTMGSVAVKKSPGRVDLAQYRSSPFRKQALVVILDRSVIPTRKEHDDASHGDGQGDEEL
jgi:hypothetical protein